MNPEILNLDHAARDHAKYGPSSFSRYVKCPWSMFDMESFPSESNIYAAEGQLGHECAELMLEAKLEGTKYPRLDTEKYDAEMRSCARGYAEFIYSTVKEHLEKPHYWAIEKKLVIDRVRDIWGTCDYLFVYKDSEESNKLNIILFDYKYGAVPVEVKNNWQVVGYLWGAKQTILEESLSKDPVMGRAEAYIYQPRVWEGDLKEYLPEPWLIDFSVLESEFIPVLEAVINKSEQWTAQGFVSPEEEKKFTKTGDHCKYCLKKGACNAYKEVTSGPVLALFRNIASRVAIKADTMQGVITEEYEAGVISQEELVFIALNAAKIKTFVEAAAKVPLEMIKKGFVLPGCKVIETNARRSLIPDEQKLIAGLKALGIKDPTETTTKVIGLTEIEKLLGKGKIDHLTANSGEKSYKLVEEDHKSPAVEFGLKKSAMFKSIAEKYKNKHSETPSE